MKVALILTLVTSTASAFVPGFTKNERFVSTRLFEETEEAAEPEWKGAESISGLTKDVSTVFPLEEVAKILPHRYPFALVDKVVEYEAGKVSFEIDKKFHMHCNVSFPLIFLSNAFFNDYSALLGLSK